MLFSAVHKFSHSFFVKLGILVFLFSFNNCYKSNSEKKVEAIGPGEGSLKILSWKGYIERGESDPNVDWVTNFEKETGCKIEETYANSSEEMVSFFNEGDFDVVTASSDGTLRLILSNKIQKVNVGILKNWEKVDPRFRNSPWHTIQNDHYGVPFLWGMNVLLYNTDVFKNVKPNSWKYIYEEMVLPDGKSNKGRIQSYKGVMAIADAALYLKYKNPELNIGDIYSISEIQFGKVLDLLKLQKKLIGSYWLDSEVQIQDFRDRKFVISSSYPYQVNRLKDLKEPVDSVIPQETTTGWADTILISSSAKNINCAYKWIDHLVSVNTQKDLAKWFGAVPVNLESCTASKNDPFCKKNGIDELEKINFWRTPISDCGKNITCVPLYRWQASINQIFFKK